MKRIIPFVALLAVLWVSLSCEQEPHGTLSLSEESSVFGADGGLLRVTVTASHNWTCNTGTEGMIFTTKKGEAGSTAIEISVPGNPSEEDRSIVVKFNCEDAKATLEIKQYGAVFDTLFIHHSSRELDAPLFEGSGFTGTVIWGDGSSDEFSPSIPAPLHNYSSADSTVITVKVHDSDAFILPSMSRVSKIDLKKF